MPANDIANVITSKTEKKPSKSEKVTILCAVRPEKLKTNGSFSYLRPVKKTVKGSSEVFTIFGAGVHSISRDAWDWLGGTNESGALNDSHGLIATGQVFLILDGTHIYRDAVVARTLSGGTVAREEWIKQCFSPSLLTLWRDQIAAMTAEEFKEYSDYSERRAQIEKRLKEMDEGKITPPRHPSFGDDTGLAAFY